MYVYDSLTYSLGLVLDVPLSLDEALERTVLANEIVVRAELGDAAAVQHGDGVRPFDGRQPVGDDDDGSVPLGCGASIPGESKHQRGLTMRRSSASFTKYSLSASSALVASSKISIFGSCQVSEWNQTQMGDSGP